MTAGKLKTVHAHISGVVWRIDVAVGASVSDSDSIGVSSSSDPRPRASA